MPDTPTLQEPESASEFNEAFIRLVEGSGDGHVKGASTRGGDYVRWRLRENGFFRNILPTEPITDGQFDRQLDYDEPVVIEDMEPESPMAKSIPFNDTPDLAPFRGRRFMVRFAKITTPEFLKNIDELRTYKMDLRQVITDNALKDMETEEDARFISTIDRIVGPSTGNGLAGVRQNHEISGRIVRPSYKNILNHLEDLDLNNGMFLMNRHTAKEFLGWDHDEVGGEMAQTLFTEGLRGLPKMEIMGVPHLATIKRAIVPDFVIYQFAEKSYMGKAYQLQEPTMYVEKKKDIIRFCAQQKLGFTVARRKFDTRDEFRTRDVSTSLPGNFETGLEGNDPDSTREPGCIGFGPAFGKLIAQGSLKSVGVHRFRQESFRVVGEVGKGTRRVGSLQQDLQDAA